MASWCNDYVAPWCSGCHYCPTSFNKARTQVLRRFKPCSRSVGVWQWWESLTMVPAEIRLNMFCRSAIPQKQLIIIIIIIIIIIRKELLSLFSYQFIDKSGNIIVNPYITDVTNDIHISINVKKPPKVPIIFLASSLENIKRTWKS